MSNEIEWATPPEYDNQTGRVRRFVDALQSRPGEWAKYPKPAHRSAAVTNARSYLGTEWTVRPRGDGKYDLYGRWVGE